MYKRTCCLFTLCVALPASSFADFRYDESTRITGGAAVSMAKFAGAFSKQARQITDPINSTILVKGNRMAHVNKDSTEIIDLDKETVTNLDHAKKQYSIITFQEMKAAQEEAIQKAQQQASQPPPPTTAPTTNNPPPPQLKFKVNVTNTGASKDVAGLAASETILKMSVEAKDVEPKDKSQTTGQTGSLAMTNDMWMAPEIPGYGEIRDFYVRMASRMGTVFSGVLPALLAPQLAAQPDMFSGMGDMVKEMSKLKGVPVSQTMRVGTTADGSPLPAASEAPLPESNTPTAGSIANKAAVGAATSASDTAAATAENKAASRMGNFGGIATGLGGFGGFHKKKQKTEEPTPASATPPAAPQSAVLIESTTEMTGFSSGAIDTMLFNVPAGYSKVPSEYQKAHQ